MCWASSLLYEWTHSKLIGVDGARLGQFLLLIAVKASIHYSFSVCVVVIRPHYTFYSTTQQLPFFSSTILFIWCVGACVRVCACACVCDLSWLDLGFFGWFILMILRSVYLYIFFSFIHSFIHLVHFNLYICRVCIVYIYFPFFIQVGIYVALAQLNARTDARILISSIIIIHFANRLSGMEYALRTSCNVWQLAFASNRSSQHHYCYYHTI